MSPGVFSRNVLALAKAIPQGRVTTYVEIARAAGNPHASRAAGNALNKNPRPIRVPCHRVVCSDGRIGGYSLGARKKITLLNSEGIQLRRGRVAGFQIAFFRFQ